MVGIRVGVSNMIPDSSRFNVNVHRIGSIGPRAPRHPFLQGTELLRMQANLQGRQLQVHLRWKRVIRAPFELGSSAPQFPAGHWKVLQFLKNHWKINDPIFGVQFDLHSALSKPQEELHPKSHKHPENRLTKGLYTVIIGMPLLIMQLCT